MQTVIQVIATGAGSLRNKIMSDPQLEKKFDFIKVWHKQPSRPHGWAKIHSTRDVHGAINVEWHARSRTLICSHRVPIHRSTHFIFDSHV